MPAESGIFSDALRLTRNIIRPAVTARADTG